MQLFNTLDSNNIDLLDVNNGYDKVFVYIVDMDKYTNNLDQFWSFLSIGERKQARSYYTKLLTDRYVISHGILRYILSYYTKQPAHSLKFINNRYGKPFLKDSNIQFNMSHSYNMVYYIVAHNYKVGIDIEFHDNTLDVMELSNLVLTPKEITLLESFSIEERYKTFYTLWARKEALVKAIGKGLSYPINTIEAMPIASYDKITLTSNNNNAKQELYSYTLRTTPNYSGAIATETKIDVIVYLEAINQQGVFEGATLDVTYQVYESWLD